jgi:hypothetical protein
MEATMKAGSRGVLRLAAALGLAAAATAKQNARAYPDAIQLPKVEFIEVAGRQCLQPVVHEARAAVADYRAAESRWLASKHPGVPTPQAKTDIVQDPEASGDGQPERTTVVRETFYLDGIVGSGAVVCFDINLVTNPGEPQP